MSPPSTGERSVQDGDPPGLPPLPPPIPPPVFPPPSNDVWYGSFSPSTSSPLPTSPYTGSLPQLAYQPRQLALNLRPSSGSSNFPTPQNAYISPQASRNIPHQAMYPAPMSEAYRNTPQQQMYQVPMSQASRNVPQPTVYLSPASQPSMRHTDVQSALFTSGFSASDVVIPRPLFLLRFHGLKLQLSTNVPLASLSPVRLGDIWDSILKAATEVLGKHPRCLDCNECHDMQELWEKALHLKNSIVQFDHRGLDNNKMAAFRESLIDLERLYMEEGYEGGCHADKKEIPKTEKADESSDEDIGGSQEGVRL